MLRKYRCSPSDRKQIVLRSDNIGALDHTSPEERARLDDLLRLIPGDRSSALEIGARDGFISSELVRLFTRVTALDVEMPAFDHERITKVQGDVRSLQFPDNAFDVVVCAEVLEHLPPEDLGTACSEIMRVARHEAVIGVPYKQDLRLGKTTCRTCGGINPPYGHLNTFDERKLSRLFRFMNPVMLSFVGLHSRQTNALSSALMTVAGNPYGTYDQWETCVYCGERLLKPQSLLVHGKVIAGLARLLEQGQHHLTRPYPVWIHMVFRKDKTLY